MIVIIIEYNYYYRAVVALGAASTAWTLGAPYRPYIYVYVYVYVYVDVYVYVHVYV